MDSIKLTGISAEGIHGVLDFEHEKPQPFVVDAELFLDVSKAGRSDDLADTVDYGQIASRIVSVIEGEHVDLIETLAERIASSILQTAAIKRVKLTVHKPQAPIRVPFDDVSVSIERSRIADAGGGLGSGLDGGLDAADNAGADSHHVVIAMGGNIGDPVRAMRSALVAIDAVPGNQIIGISPLFKTHAWGMEDGTPDFFNAVVEITTTLTPQTLLNTLQLVEAAHGRSREVHWGSRPLDLDIIDFDGIVSFDPALTLPHPRAWQRAFVLAPLLALEPEYSLPGEHGGSVRTLLDSCPDKDSVQRVSDDWILGTERD
jgi:dihydroneopterin aldolase/2-amino-4-hydroxy-6-hydroxymethyldihydropteridine diphosphokinase